MRVQAVQPVQFIQTPSFILPRDDSSRGLELFERFEVTDLLLTRRLAID